MPDVEQILSDLHAESVALDGMVADLPPEAWRLETPAKGWTVAHQIGHLVWTDEVARTAATDPDAFTDWLGRAAGPQMVDDAAAELAAAAPDELLGRWRRARSELADALRAVPAGTKVPWFGPPMSAASMATARSMETWAHGQDVADALGREHGPGAVLQHVAHIGVRTRDFAYAVNGRTPPQEPFRVELTAPDGGLWTWGPEAAGQVVRGPAVDFCLLVTQRRNRADLSVQATGREAEEWLDIAQAFAGPPGGGREPAARP